MSAFSLLGGCYTPLNLLYYLLFKFGKEDKKKKIDNHGEYNWLAQNEESANALESDTNSNSDDNDDIDFDCIAWSACLRNFSFRQQQESDLPLADRTTP